MKANRMILACCLVMTASACSPKLLPPSSIEEVTETVREIETVHDTIVRVEPGSTILSALIECSEKGEARLKEIEQLRASQRTQTTVSMDDNRLEIKTVVDSMGIYIQFKERYKEREKSQKVIVTETVEVNVLYWWQEVLIRVGLLALVFVVLRVSYGLLKPRLNGILTVLKNLLKK